MREEAVVFGRARHLVGVYCSPSDARPSVPTTVFLNSGIVHHVGANRIHVRLARSLADAGYPSLRFDLSGIGDSAASPEGADVRRREVVARDVSDAVSHTEARDGARGVLLLGLCSGADDALANLIDHPGRLGAIAIDPDVIRTTEFFLRDAWRSARRPGAWKRLLHGESKLFRQLAQERQRRSSPDGASVQNTSMRASEALSTRQLKARIAHLVAQQKVLYYVFTAGIPQRYNHDRQFHRAFRGIDLGDRVDHRYLPAADHTFSSEAHREELERDIVAWMRKRFPG